MEFTFDADQEALRDAVRRFVTAESPSAYVRTMFEDERGFTDEVWGAVVDLGWTGLLVPEEHGGLGLGLTLVNRLIELHGGTVEVRSSGPQQGSEFVVRLPVIPAPEADLENFSTEDLEPVRCNGQRRILVADDFPESAELLARLLRRDGSDVRVALDGLEAVETAVQFQPDIVLLDIAMPKLDGYEAARKIRQQSWGKKAILIALTGWGQQQDRRRTREAGFDVHLTKPINYQAIAKLLHDLSGDARLAERLGAQLV